MSYLNTDVPELKGFDTGTVLGNIELLEGRLEGILEATVAEVFELSEAILQDASGDTDTVFSILLSLRGQPGEAEISPLKARHLLSQNVPVLEKMTRHLGLYERLLLYRLVTARVPDLPLFEAVSDNILPASARGRVAYMPGAFADKAYIRFAEEIPHCRAASFHSFVDACEEVRGGLCEFCILPLESTADGKLMGFARLIIKYRLQIVAVCDIRGSAGGQESTTRFALLQNAGEDRERSPLSPLFRNHPNHYLELLHMTANPPYNEIIAAAEFCGLSLARVDTMPAGGIPEILAAEDWLPPVANQGIAPLISTVWQTERADLTAFLCYLSLENSDDPIIGFYPCL